MPLQKPITKDHWKDLASQWNRIGPPLRPSPEDVQIAQQLLGTAEGLHLLLGVTPELSNLTPQLVAIDNNAGMIGAVWPGNCAGHNAVQADWLDMPFADHSFDAVIADGSFSLLHYPLQYRQLFSQLKRIMKPGSKLVLRVFASPVAGETCAAVCHDAMVGQAGGFHAFKWRLAMALAAESQNPNISVADIHEIFCRLLPDRMQLGDATDWSQEDIATIDFYQGSPARYSFPTLQQLRQVMSPEFSETGLMHGSYELAERYPTLVLEIAK